MQYKQCDFALQCEHSYLQQLQAWAEVVVVEVQASLRRRLNRLGSLRCCQNKA